MSIIPPVTETAGERSLPRPVSVSAASSQPPRATREKVAVLRPPPVLRVIAPFALRPAALRDRLSMRGVVPRSPEISRDPVLLRGLLHPSAGIDRPIRLRSELSANLTGAPLVMSSRNAPVPAP